MRADTNPAVRHFTTTLMFFASALTWTADAERADSQVRVATFSADVTIPLDHRCMGVLPTKSQRILDPLFAHGLVLLSGDDRYVLCAVDWCEIRNDSFDAWRSALGEAAGTSPDRVMVTALHQHDAPVIDGLAGQILDEVDLHDELFDREFHDRTISRVAQAVKDSLEKTKPVTHIGLGQSEVERIASNRRVLLDDGRVTFGRGSRSGANELFRDASEGEIDPLLRTISFWNGDQPLVAIHNYATHPMSFYGRGDVSADFVGLARDRRQRDDFSIRQIYTPGCSGDVTAGKYNDGSIDSRIALTERLYDAMVNAWRTTRRLPIEPPAFRCAQLELPYSTDANLQAERLEQALRDESLSVEDRILAAMGLASRRRVDQGRPIDVPCLDFGVAQIVLMPAEAFVGYQLMAQELRPDSMVMTMGYGECWPGYIPTDAAFADGFTDKWLWVGKDSETPMKQALTDVLTVSRE